MERARDDLVGSVCTFTAAAGMKKCQFIIELNAHALAFLFFREKHLSGKWLIKYWHLGGSLLSIKLGDMQKQIDGSSKVQVILTCSS